MLKSILCLIFRGTGPADWVTAVTTEEEEVTLHPSSINNLVDKFPSPYLTYYLKRKSSKIYLLDSTSVSPVALLFASPKCSISNYKKYFYLIIIYK